MEGLPLAYREVTGDADRLFAPLFAPIGKPDRPREDDRLPGSGFSIKVRRASMRGQDVRLPLPASTLACCDSFWLPEA
jgi:hypothetical protein